MPYLPAPMARCQLAMRDPVMGLMVLSISGGSREGVSEHGLSRLSSLSRGRSGAGGGGWSGPTAFTVLR